MKKACSFDNPCESCQARQEICSYQRLSVSDNTTSQSLSEAPISLPHVPNQGNPDITQQSTPYHGNSAALALNDATDLSPTDQAISDKRESYDITESSADSSANALNIDWIDWDLCPSLLYPPGNNPSFTHTFFDHADTLEFLSQFTSGKGFVDSFECGTDWEKQQVALSPAIRSSNNVSTSVRAGGYDDLNISNDWVVNPLTGSLPHVELDLNGLPSHNNTMRARRQAVLGSSIPITAKPFAESTENPLAQLSAGRPRMDKDTKSPAWADWLDDPLAIKTRAIVDKLKETAYKNSKKHCLAPKWSPLMEELCLRLFSPQSIRQFLTYFWSLWYPNSPIIHKPTFKAEQASTVLLATMVVIGACVSPYKADNENVKLWFDSVEEITFKDEWFQGNPTFGRLHQSEISLVRCKRLESLQAAYFVCLFQNWEGSDEAKQRIRRYRHSSVAIVRIFHCSFTPPDSSVG